MIDFLGEGSGCDAVVCIVSFGIVTFPISSVSGKTTSGVGKSFSCGLEGTSGFKFSSIYCLGAGISTASLASYLSGIMCEVPGC